MSGGNGGFRETGPRVAPLSDQTGALCQTLGGPVGTCSSHSSPVHEALQAEEPWMVTLLPSPHPMQWLWAACFQKDTEYLGEEGWETSEALRTRGQRPGVRAASAQ